MTTKKTEQLDDQDLDQAQGGIASVQDLPGGAASTGDFMDSRRKPDSKNSVILSGDDAGEIMRYS